MFPGSSARVDATSHNLFEGEYDDDEVLCDKDRNILVVPFPDDQTNDYHRQVDDERVDDLPRRHASVSAASTSRHTGKGEGERRQHEVKTDDGDNRVVQGGVHRRSRLFVKQLQELNGIHEIQVYRRLKSVYVTPCFLPRFPLTASLRRHGARDHQGVHVDGDARQRQSDEHPVLTVIFSRRVTTGIGYRRRPVLNLIFCTGRHRFHRDRVVVTSPVEECHFSRQQRRVHEPSDPFHRQTALVVGIAAAATAAADGAEYNHTEHNHVEDDKNHKPFLADVPCQPVQDGILKDEKYGEKQSVEPHFLPQNPASSSIVQTPVCTQPAKRNKINDRE